MKACFEFWIRTLPINNNFEISYLLHHLWKQKKYSVHVFEVFYVHLTHRRVRLVCPGQTLDGPMSPGASIRDYPWWNHKASQNDWVFRRMNYKILRWKSSIFFHLPNQDSQFRQFHSNNLKRTNLIDDISEIKKTKLWSRLTWARIDWKT